MGRRTIEPMEDLLRSSLTDRAGIRVVEAPGEWLLKRWLNERLRVSTSMPSTCPRPNYRHHGRLRAHGSRDKLNKIVQVLTKTDKM